MKSKGMTFLVDQIMSAKKQRQEVVEEPDIMEIPCEVLDYNLLRTTVTNPLSMGLFRQEYWSGLPFPSPGDFPAQGLNPRLLH